ncbi:MAG TPA: hypothetical protein VI382_05955 [Candidatus Manganitrophaceae bacterium]|nr:hypothetical protein [Candidatus Manganitrophaceae bacterium]
MRLVARAAVCGASFLFFLLSACAPSLHHQALVEQNLLAHRYTDADAVVEKNKEDYGERNALLYYFDRGMLLHLAGRYEESNVFFEKAGALVEELYTQSVSTHAGALLTNDNLLPYEGEDFEKVLIHLFSALNYASMGQWDEALVEARRVDARLNLLNDRYSPKSVYKEDAFARYLSGILYEARGESNDAFISYRKAYEAFQEYQKFYRTPIPERIGSDLITLSKILRLREEQEEYKKAFPQSVSQATAPASEQEGEMVIVAYGGRSPIKEDYFIDAPVPDGSGGVYMLRVALPKFVPQPSQVDSVEVVLQKGETTLRRRFDLLEDITAIAKKNLEDRIGRISGKAIARATAKYLAGRTAKREAKKRGGEGAELLTGFLSNVYSVASEQADKRSWRTLPGRIYLARISLPEGAWRAKIRYYSKEGTLIEEGEVPNVVIEKRKKRFFIDQTIR